MNIRYYLAVSCLSHNFWLRYRTLALRAIVQLHCMCEHVQKTCLNRTRSHCKFRSVKVITSLHNRQCVWNSTPTWHTPTTGWYC